MEAVAGGYGARPTRDGINTGGSFCIPMGRVPDAEVTELLYPLLVLWRQEEVDSGGAGRQRGGTSCAIAMTPHGTSLPAHVVLSASGKATAQNPGLSGGYPGALGHDVIVHGARVDTMLKQGNIPATLSQLTGDTEVSQCFAESVLAPGDVIYLNCQGGGGYGDPILRDAESVSLDYQDNLISRAAAAELYGVVLADDGTVDQSATERRRADMKAQRKRAMKTASLLPGTVDIGSGRAIDDNLTLISSGGKAELACIHCGQRLGDEDNVLHVGVIEGPSSLAGPGVRAAPEFFVDEAVAFTQFVCPGCATALHTAVAPKGEVLTLSGFALD